MKLYGYFRSSTAYRVRIALNLKGVLVKHVPVHMLRGGGEQHQPAYRAINPQGVIPTLVDGDVRLGQSLAIIEYLEETRPTPALLPADPLDRARVRQLANIIACDIHPIDNLRVLTYITTRLGASAQQKADWYRHWILEGFKAFEALIADDPRTGAFCHGDQPGLADLCLIPQVYNARRFDCPLDDFPTIARIDAACNALEAFRKAAPENQIDAPPAG